MKKVILPEQITSDEYDAFCKTADHLAPLVKEICAMHGFHAEAQKHIKYASNIVFEIDESYFFKLYSPLSECEYLRESATLAFLKGKIDIPIPTVLAEGAVQAWRYLILSKVQGVRLSDVRHELSTNELCELNEELGHTIATIHNLPPPIAPSLQVDWTAFLEQNIGHR